MLNKYIIIFGIIGVLFFTSTSYGQDKQFPIPHYSKPSQKKPNLNNRTAITPNNDESVTRVHKPKPKMELVNGSFSASLEKESISKENAIREFNQWFGLNENHTFQQVSEKIDELGFTHTNFQQRYSGYLIEGSIVMLHSKNGTLTSTNGQVAVFSEIELQKVISGEEAKEKAMSDLNVTKLINDYPVETIIVRIPSEKGVETKLVQKVRIDSYSPFVMCHVYIDAKTGSILNKINLIAHADVAGTGQTLYSGTQPIICDSHLGSYRLRDNARKIETYDATNATDLDANGFVGSTDFTNSSTTWSGIPILSSLTISVVSQSWWYTSLADELPDLYFKVKDGSNQVVYTSNYFNNTNPPMTFTNFNIYLTNGPYTVEVWDHDAVGDHDLGGSYTIVTNTGTQSWSGNGNNGTYLIANTGHPALDVHWGMEKSYDFYLNTFGRDSYDGAGSVIKQYLNPSSLFIIPGEYGPNNAGAIGAPYNVMVYGMGDGQTMSPVVGLDVEGHEFTHMVVNNNGNGGLTYQAESGALNESFADIFGVCVEFYSNVNPDWLIGEDVMVGQPFMRSMSNPNGGQQPDTYNGTHWANTANLSSDHGGVHTNSGVQNFWFHLLCLGGSGTNDNSNAYSVTGIGITQARQIAYRNLITYLGPNATYTDAYNGSLQAAQDLYGNPSTQYTAVREAWYAVGIGNAPSSYCSGTTDLIASSGMITDGSGSADYNNNANCKWVISPPGATQISLNFTTFDTEATFDFVYVYDGPDDTYPVLATWSGNTLPPTITTTAGVGSMCVKFTSDNNTLESGWSANYTSIGITPSCDGGTVLANPSGTFNDGSGAGTYGNNQLCYWLISPPCATSVTLSFSQFNTEQNFDFVIVYDDWEGTNLLGILSGTSIPTSITSTTGKMFVIFASDYASTLQGFAASYTSTGSAYCSGLTNLNTLDNGILTDGSGSNNYCNNSDCQWLIQPPTATSVTLNFTTFDLEQASSDGLSIYDAVEVFDGTTTAAPLLGRYTGNNLPPAVTSTGGNLLVRFFSDLEVARQGWSAYYTSTQTPYCTGNTALTAASGTFSDGSSSNQYANNSNCSWLIQPTNASSVTLSFSAFNTELNYDGVIVYDGSNNIAPVLGQFSGNSIPSAVTSIGGSMYVEFVSDPAAMASGWTANYTSTIISSTDNLLVNQGLKIFPNPTEGIFTVNSTLESALDLQILDVLGKQVLKKYTIVNGTNQIDASELSKGIYLIKVSIGDSYYMERLAID